MLEGSGEGIPVGSEQTYPGAITMKKLLIAGLLLLTCFLLFHVDSATPVSERKPPSERTPPRIEEYATIEGYCDGVPIYSFGNLCFIYEVSPELLPSAPMQEGNTNLRIKVKPKKSWEIRHNLCGATHEMTVKSPWTDSQPFLPIHLIDGDPDTLWCSWGCPVADGRPEWIRIDLPRESTVAAVALVCSRGDYWQGPRANYGRALPCELEIRLSRDAWHWETVYQTKNLPQRTTGTTEIKFNPEVGQLTTRVIPGQQNTGTTLIKFQPRPAKQIWIVANNFPTEVGFAGHVFSIGEVEVRDPAGTNLALVSRGAGVTVSSKTSSHDNDWMTQKVLWGPLQYDLGNKWVRVGSHNGSFCWNYVELEKGKLKIDPWADESISECVRAGIKVIMNLDITMGNYRYGQPPRGLDWRQKRFREVNNNYEDPPPRPYDNPASWAGFLRYIDYMARQFKGRVYLYELGNEWNVVLPPERYMKYFEEMYNTLKRADPEARVMLGNTAGALHMQDVLYCLGYPWRTGIHDGKLLVEQETLLLADCPKAKNASLSVQAIHTPRKYQVGDTKVHVDRDEGQFGIILDYRNPDNYLAALYSVPARQMFFSEVKNGRSGPNIALKDTGKLGGNLRFDIKIEQTKVTYTLSDGNQSISTSAEFQGRNLEGSFGLIFQFTNPKHYGASWLFDNLSILDQAGKALLREEFDGPEGTAPAGLRYVYGYKNPIGPGWGARLDAVGWHSEGMDRAYVDAVRQFKKECAALGFRGSYFCSEIGPSRGWLYPPGPPHHRSEIEYAKVQQRKLFCNLGVDAGAAPCHPHFTGFYHDQPLTRTTWPTSTLVPLNGGASYYVWRTAATVTDGFHARDFPVSFVGQKKLMWLTFEKMDKNQLLIAAWNPETLTDEVTNVKCDVIVPGTQAKRAWGIDLFNGIEQELQLAHDRDATVLKGMLIKDYPTLIRLEIR